MTRLAVIAGILPVLLLCHSVSPCLSIAEQGKVPGGGYVVQMGAFRDQKNAGQTIRDLRAAGVELFWSRKDNGLHVVQSRRFASRAAAQAFAARLTADRLINTYVITAAPGKFISRISGDEEHPAETGHKPEQPATGMAGQPAETSVFKAPALPDDQSSTAVSAVLPIHIDDTPHTGEDAAAQKHVQIEAVAGQPAPPLDKELFIQEFKLVEDRDDSATYAAFASKYDRELKQCSMPEAFSKIASFFARKGQPDKAADIYRTLFFCSESQDVRIAALSSLKPLIPPLELFAMYEHEQGVVAKVPEQLKKLDSFKSNLLFNLLESEPEKLEAFADAVLAFYPADRTALTALAWHQFRRGHYEQAYSYFSELNRLEPEQTDHVTGMIYALSGIPSLEKVMERAPAVSSYFYAQSGELRK